MRTYLKKFRAYLLLLVLAPAIVSLTGCARPNDEDMVEMLSNAYQCKWVKVDAYKKTDSLPGIWTYIAQYDFNLRFKDGDAGAYMFIKGLYNAVPGQTDWKKVLQTPAARAYIREQCAPPAQRVMEQIAIQAYTQLADKKLSQIKIPTSVKLTGWAETTSGRGGWAMEMRRDKVKQEYIMSAPIPKVTVMSKIR